jgi:hypothetical protein
MKNIAGVDGYAPASDIESVPGCGLRTLLGRSE